MSRFVTSVLALIVLALIVLGIMAGGTPHITVFTASATAILARRSLVRVLKGKVTIRRNNRDIPLRCIMPYDIRQLIINMVTVSDRNFEFSAHHAGVKVEVDVQYFSDFQCGDVVVVWYSYGDHKATVIISGSSQRLIDWLETFEGRYGYDQDSGEYVPLHQM